jgi:glucose/arabinose dehydrogenase
MRKHVVTLALAAVLAGACAGAAKQPVSVGMGPQPQLPKPDTPLIPTVKIADAAGWPAGVKPNTAAGLETVAFASGLNHPRWLHVLPNGDVLVAETNAPPKPDDGKGIKGWFMKQAMKNAGAGVPSPNRIVVLRDADHDGMAEARSILLEGLNSPFGMALVGDRLYVANSDAIWSYAFKPGQTKITDLGKKLTDLPAGTLNHHWTKNIIASKDGAKLYATVGSNSNVGENGMDKEEGRAAIWEVDIATGSKRIFATGIRNPNGLAWEPVSGALWTAVNERDELGHNLVPDYITSVKDGGFYGWPYSYYGQTVDARVKPQKPDLVASAIKPDYALGAHTASLGLTFAERNNLGPNFAQGAFIGQHGSWNRNPVSGYKVIFVPFANGKPSGDPVDVLTGFLDAKGKAQGRPVGVAIAGDGSLLVADDVGNAIWRVSGPGGAAQVVAQ